MTRVETKSGAKTSTFFPKIPHFSGLTGLTLLKDQGKNHSHLPSPIPKFRVHHGTVQDVLHAQLLEDGLVLQRRVAPGELRRRRHGGLLHLHHLSQVTIITLW